MVQGHLESDSSVVEIRNNAILQENCSLLAHINDSFSNFTKDYVLCVLGEPTQPENPSIFLGKGVCNQSSIQGEKRESIFNGKCFYQQLVLNEKVSTIVLKFVFFFPKNQPEQFLKELK